VTLLLILLFVMPQVSETSVCWAEQVIEEGSGQTTSITRCRVSGAIVDYGSEREIPFFLYPDVGTAANGTCWFWRSTWARWEIIVRYVDGTATLGYDPDEIPGGPIGVEATYSVCISEPDIAVPLEPLVWDLIREYVHQRPQPELNPAIPLGLAGAETHVAVDPPSPFAASIVSPLGQLEVEAWVGAVSIDWGDGTRVNLPPESFPLLTGYPDGIARHVYETKTCEPPGSGRRCHSSLSAYPFEVIYQWQVRWRVSAGAWQELAVPDSATSLAYPVQEVIAVLSAYR
jgi:hypothetical protein